MYKRFDSIEELVDNISRGGEIEFEYQGENYSITQPKGEINIMKFYDYSTLKTYQCPWDVVDYEIENSKIEMIIKDIVVKFRCF